MHSSELRGHLRLHFVVFLWGFTAILGQLISLPATQLVWHRMLIALAGLLVWVKFKNIDLSIGWKPALQMIVTGGITAAHWITFFHAVKISNVSITLACMSSGALFVSFIEPIIYKRRIVLSEIFFGLLTIIGISVIFQVAGGYRMGIIVALISAALAALFAVINGVFAKTYRPTVVTTYEMLGGVIAITIYLGLTAGFDPTMFSPPAIDWLYLGILGTVCTAYAFIVSVDVTKILNPYTVVLTINMEPIYGIILAFIIFGDAEKMTPSFYLGASVILAAVFGNALLRKWQKRKVVKRDHS